jgi:hypothetical protein
MKKENQNIIIFSSVAGAIIVATLIWFFVQKSKIETEQLEREEEEKQQEIEANSNVVKPQFNRNGELTNPMSEISGRQLIAKSDNINIRSTPRIDNPTKWGPQDHNIIAKAKKGSILGTVVGETKGEETPKMRWFKVKLLKPITVGFDHAYGLDPITAGIQIFSDRKPGTYSYAWVRADIVTFKQYTK